MKIISTNIGKPTTIQFQGQTLQTGIYKYPVDKPIYLGETDVKDDHVVDRRYHGGKEKACYIYSADCYPFWKEKYPNLDWDWGMFGENLTIEGLDETQFMVGDIYQVGQAKVQVVQPRQPCFKLGIRFNNQSVVKEFVDASYPGAYLSILENGFVQSGDELKLISRNESSISIATVYQLMFHSPFNVELAKYVIKSIKLPEGCINLINRRISHSKKQ